MTDKTQKIVAGLRSALDAALHYVQRGIAQSADASKRIAAELARARELAGALAKARSGSTSVPPADGEADHALSMDGLHLQLDQLTQHFAEQGRTLATLDDPQAQSAIDRATLESELEAIRARVRQRRGRIGARAAAQVRSAHHVETRARRLDQRIERLREGSTRLLDLELAIAGVDAALIRARVELAEAGAQLRTGERELASCARESALLRERGVTPPAARALAGMRVDRMRADLTMLDDEADRLRAHDVMSRPEGTPNDAALRDLLSWLRAAVDECSDAVWDAERSGGQARSRARESATGTAPPLDRTVLRVPLERRLRMLEALAEIRVEETQALHAALAEDPSRSYATLAHVSSVRLRLRLDEAERAWLVDALEAVEHEQGARLSHGPDREADALRELRDATTAWQRCDRGLEEAAAQTRAAKVDLVSLRGILAPALSRADAEMREQSARIRERQRTLRARRRSCERATSKLATARQRQRALMKSLRRARDALERVLVQVGDAALTDVLGRLGTLTREVEANATLIMGLRAAHEHVARAMTAIEQDLLELSRAQRATATRAMPAASPSADASATEPWARARMELDISALAEQLEDWKARHTELERRVGAQAQVLASVEHAQREDEALAALRLDFEHARSSAAASIERIRSRQGSRSPARAGEPAPGGRAEGDGGLPPDVPPARPER